MRLERTVSGRHNREPNSAPPTWTGTVHDITGVYPGPWGGDSLFSADDIAHRQTMVDRAAVRPAALDVLHGVGRVPDQQQQRGRDQVHLLRLTGPAPG